MRKRSWPVITLALLALASLFGALALGISLKMKHEAKCCYEWGRMGCQVGMQEKHNPYVRKPRLSAAWLQGYADEKAKVPR